MLKKQTITIGLVIQLAPRFRLAPNFRFEVETQDSIEAHAGFVRRMGSPRDAWCAFLESRRLRVRRDKFNRELLQSYHADPETRVLLDNIALDVGKLKKRGFDLRGFVLDADLRLAKANAAMTERGSSHLEQLEETKPGSDEMLDRLQGLLFRYGSPELAVLFNEIPV